MFIRLSTDIFKIVFPYPGQKNSFILHPEYRESSSSSLSVSNIYIFTPALALDQEMASILFILYTDSCNIMTPLLNVLWLRCLLIYDFIFGKELSCDIHPWPSPSRCRLDGISKIIALEAGDVLTAMIDGWLLYFHIHIVPFLSYLSYQPTPSCLSVLPVRPMSEWPVGRGIPTCNMDSVVRLDSIGELIHLPLCYLHS